LAKQFADQFSIDVPALIEGAISMTVDEARVNVTGDYRFGAFGPGPTFVDGIRGHIMSLFPARGICFIALGALETLACVR
jgi:hypothetical protein